METNINIAEILKNVPIGTKLYSPLFGNVYLKYIGEMFITVRHYSTTANFYHNGGLYNYEGTEPILFPSREMRDWSRFAWKRGDVLVSNDGGTEVIFDKWYDDTYTNFYSKHYLNSEDENNIKYNEAFLCTTERYSLEDKDAAQTYINTIEERLGGKLNRKTLEIEKTQPEFKDGDIVYISGMGYLAYGIVKSIDNSSKKLEYYVLNDMSTLKFEDWLSFEDKQIQPITETQQIILFDALLKKNKAWDAEKKQIVNLKPKVEFKPFDKVVAYGELTEEWVCDIFSHYSKNYKGKEIITCIGGGTYYKALPYNEETIKLLGTTKDVES